MIFEYLAKIHNFIKKSKREEDFFTKYYFGFKDSKSYSRKDTKERKVNASDLQVLKKLRMSKTSAKNKTRPTKAL